MPLAPVMHNREGLFRARSRLAALTAFFIPGEKMTRSTCWSFFAFAMALICYVMNRDISANVFLGAIMIIQGLKRAEEEDHGVTGKAMTFLVTAGTSVITFAVFARMAGLEWNSPASW
jgi:hypothetical protein